MTHLNVFLLFPMTVWMHSFCPYQKSAASNEVATALNNRNVIFHKYLIIISNETLAMPKNLDTLEPIVQNKLEPLKKRIRFQQNVILLRNRRHPPLKQMVLAENKRRPTKQQKRLAHNCINASSIFDLSPSPQKACRYKEYTSGLLSRNITPEMKEESDKNARRRRGIIKKAMIHAWSGYKKYAFGADELLPLSKLPQENWGGIGATLVDALDTLWLMGMKDEFWEARDWVRDSLSFSNVGEVSVFETTIRSLGGLLSAYDLSGDPVFLEKADDLGSRLLHAFDSPNGIPYGYTELNGTKSHNGWSGNVARIVEAGSLQVEFRYLAHMTKKQIYSKTASYVVDRLIDNQPQSGLFPFFVQNDVTEINFNQSSKVTLGAMGDSMYEYMLKTWLQGGAKERKLRSMFDKSMDGVHEKLVQRSIPDGLTYVASLEGDTLDHTMDHLACFMGGLWALGAYTNPEGLNSSQAQRDLANGKAMAYTCYQMYALSPTGLSPEIIRFEGPDFLMEDPNYMLRPETVESLFILNYLTGDPVYREWGWEIFQAIERFCRTDIAYGQIRDVSDVGVTPIDKLESYFFAETMKYLFLLFDPETPIDILNTHVFNTEAHPLRRFDAPLLFQEKK
jgi:hypothetical protein